MEKIIFSSPESSRESSREKSLRILNNFRQEREKAMKNEAKAMLNEAKKFFSKNPLETQVDFTVNNRNDEFYLIISRMAMEREWQLIVNRTWFGFCKNKLRFTKAEVVPGDGDYYSSQYKDGLY